MPLPVKVVSWEITYPKSLDVTIKGVSFFFFFKRKANVSFGKEGVTARGTLEKKGVLGSEQQVRAKRGACEGTKLRRSSLLLAASMWSSLLPLASFRGPLFCMQTVAAPSTRPAKHHIQTGTGERRKGGGGCSNGGYKAIASGEGSVQNTSPFRPLMSCLGPPWESSEGPRRPFLPPSPPPASTTDSFSRMNESFTSGSPLSHNRQRLSRFYAAFPVRGGSLSGGIEGRRDAARIAKGCPSNI